MSPAMNATSSSCTFSHLQLSVISMDDTASEDLIRKRIAENLSFSFDLFTSQRITWPEYLDIVHQTIHGRTLQSPVPSYADDARIVFVWRRAPQSSSLPAGAVNPAPFLIHFHVSVTTDSDIATHMAAVGFDFAVTSLYILWKFRGHMPSDCIDSIRLLHHDGICTIGTIACTGLFEDHYNSVTADCCLGTEPWAMVRKGDFLTFNFCSCAVFDFYNHLHNVVTHAESDD